MSLTGAETAKNLLEVELGREELKLTLEISSSDASFFWPEISPSNDIASLAYSAEKLAGHNLEIRAGDTKLNPAYYRVSVAERKKRVSPFAGKTDLRTGQKLPDFPTDKTILKVEARYALQGIQEITFHPPVDKSGLPATNIGFTSRHGATVVNNFAYLSQVETLQIDWDDPWNTAFKNLNIRRHNRAPVMSFLYIEPRQVRHDVLLRPSKLAEWNGQPFDAWTPLEQATRDALVTATKQYLHAKNPTSIDGESAEPDSTSIVFLQATDSGFALIPKTQPIELGSTLIGYRENYAVARLPSQVDVQWNLFDPTMRKVPTLIQDPAGPFPTHTTADFPVIEWTNFLKNYSEPEGSAVLVQSPRVQIPTLYPILIVAIFLVILLSRGLPQRWHWLARSLTSGTVGLIFVIAGFLILPARLATPLPAPINERQLTQASQDLLMQVAVAYQERQEQKLEQALSRLISSTDYESIANNLSRVYQPLTSVGGLGQTRDLRNFSLQHIERIEGEGDLAFRTIAQWQATVEGHYWGHSDRRQYQIRADLEIRQQGNSWKIAAFTPLKLN
ncbi:hypothetical protein [Microbulbifer agarilyticus]